MVRSAVFVVATLLVLAGCGGDPPKPSAGSTADGTSDAASVATSPAATEPPPDNSPRAARVAYAAALSALMEVDTGHVKAWGSLSVDFGVTLDSDYAISSASSRGLLKAGGIPGASESPRLYAMATSDRGEGWYRRTDENGDPQERCWTHVARDDPPAADDPIRFMPLGFPAAITVLASGRGLLKTRSDIRVQVDLYDLALVYGPAVADELGIDHEGQGVASIIVVVTDGQITSWQTTSGDFLRAVEEAGLELPPALADYRTQVRTTVGAAVSDVGATVDVAAPSTDERCAS